MVVQQRGATLEGRVRASVNHHAWWLVAISWSAAGVFVPHASMNHVTWYPAKLVSAVAVTRPQIGRWRSRPPAKAKSEAVTAKCPTMAGTTDPVVTVARPAA